MALIVSEQACPARERGFSLVEALIALAIVAVTTAVLYTSIAQDARTRRMVADRRLAVLVAQTVLDRAAATTGTGADDAAQGSSQGLLWTVAREPHGQADAFDRAPLERLTVTVADARQRPLFSLSTMRIRP